MFDCLQKRVALGTVGRLPSPPQAAPNLLKAMAQALDQMIKRFQPEGQPQAFMAGLERGRRKQRLKHFPEQRRADRVARQHVGQEQRKRFAATAPLPAIGTKDPLAASAPAITLLRVVAVKNAVPV